MSEDTYKTNESFLAEIHQSILGAIPKQDGTYILTANGWEDYAAKWAYGYIVATTAIEIDTVFEIGDLVGVWIAPDGYKWIDHVKHVTGYDDAVKLGNDYNQIAIWDLRVSDVVIL